MGLIIKKSGAWNEFGRYYKENNYKNIVVVTDNNLKEIFGDYFNSCVKGLNIIYKDGLQFKTKEKPNYSISGADLIVGFGGGTNIDQAKLFAKKNSVKWVALPTKPTAAILSHIASVPKKNKRLTIKTPPVCRVFLDKKIINNIPIKLLQSEYGDSLSGLTAVPDAILSNIDEGEKVNYKLLRKTYAIARSALRIKKLDSTEGIRKLYDINFEYGRIMNSYGSTIPSSGVEHSISHALDFINKKKKLECGLHGVQVGFGTLIGASLQHKLKNLTAELKQRGIKTIQLDKLKIGLKKKGLPITIKEMGLSIKEFKQVLKRARTIRPEKRYTILEKYSDRKIIDGLAESGIYD